MIDVREAAIRAVERELEQFGQDEAAIAAGLRLRSQRHPRGRSMVYSIRLDQGEVAALERRAAARGVKPTVLARNLIRAGLSTDRSIAEAVGRLERVVEELRDLAV